VSGQLEVANILNEQGSLQGRGQGTERSELSASPIRVRAPRWHDALSWRNAPQSGLLLLAASAWASGCRFDAPGGTSAQADGASFDGAACDGCEPAGGGSTADTQCVTVCGSTPGAPNNAGVCATDGLCHCCLDRCGIDPQSGLLSGCVCVACSTDADCVQRAFPTCLRGVCISASATFTRCQ
jgi:hypothetical protein